MTEPWLESQNACYAGITNDGNYTFVNQDSLGTSPITKWTAGSTKRAKHVTPASCIVVHTPSSGTHSGTQRVVGIAVDPIQHPCESFSVQVSGVVDVQFKDPKDRVDHAQMVGMDLDASDPEKTARARVLLTPFRVVADF